jgi:hypothetical protein
MTQIDVLIFKRLQRNFYFVAVLRKKNSRKKNRKDGGSKFHGLNLSRKNI